MGSRSKARECALQALHAHVVTHEQRIHLLAQPHDFVGLRCGLLMQGRIYARMQTEQARPQW